MGQGGGAQGCLKTVVLQLTGNNSTRQIWGKTRLESLQNAHRRGARLKKNAHLHTCCFAPKS